MELTVSPFRSDDKIFEESSEENSMIVCLKNGSDFPSNMIIMMMMKMAMINNVNNGKFE